MTRPFLTPVRKKILDFMADFEREKGFPPTQQEVADHMGRCKVTAHESINALVKLGCLVKGEKGKSRNCRVAPEYLEVPEPWLTVSAAVAIIVEHVHDIYLRADIEDALGKAAVKPQ